MAEALDDVQEAHVLGALEGAAGAAGAVPQGRGGKELLPLAVKNLPDNQAGGKIRGDFAHRATRGAGPAGKAAQEVAAARFPGHFLLEQEIEVLQAKFLIHGGKSSDRAIQANLRPHLLLSIPNSFLSTLIYNNSKGQNHPPSP